MTIKLSSKGSGFSSKTGTSVATITTGATGTILTLTPPAGQRVKLTGLVGDSTMTSLTTILFDAVAVVTAVLLASGTGSAIALNNFKIGFTDPNQDVIIGGVDAELTITTNVATSHDIHYTYQYGI